MPLFVHRNRWWPSDQAYDWGQNLWVHRWLMRQISARKSIGQWGRGMVAAVADVALFSKVLLPSSAAAFLLVSQTFAPRLTTSRHLSQYCARYSKQLRVIPKDFMEIFSVFLKCFFWLPWECLPWESSPWSSFFGRRWSFMRTTWPAQRSWDCIKMV